MAYNDRLSERVAGVFAPRGLTCLFGLLLLLSPGSASAHPGSGIVVDREGNVYFVDTGSGVWKIDTAGVLTRVPGIAYHWMTIDPDGKLAGATLPAFGSGGATVTRATGNPALILSSDFPVAVGPDGGLLYPWMESGTFKLFHCSSSGETTVTQILSPDGRLRWLNGLAVSPDGLIYYSEDLAIRVISAEGRISTLVGNIEVPDCGSVPGIGPEVGPWCRGLAVDSAGTAYVAASGCAAVLKITPGGSVTKILQASGPWSPTGVALHYGDVYVLEYLHTEGDDRREWLPRVRKISPDGTVTTIATVER